MQQDICLVWIMSGNSQQSAMHCVVGRPKIVSTPICVSLRDLPTRHARGAHNQCSRQQRLLHLGSSINFHIPFSLYEKAADLLLSNQQYLLCKTVVYGRTTYSFAVSAKFKGEG